MNDKNKVTFTEDFIKKTKNSFNPRKKNKLLMERFNKITIDQLNQVQTRRDLAYLLGYTEANLTAGYSFVNRLLQKGYITEKFVSVDRYNKKINEYSFAAKDFRYKEGVKSTVTKEAPASRELNIPKAAPVVEKVIIKTSAFEITIENPSLETLRTILDETALVA